METITNLVLEGGGVGAIAYAGFLARAETTGLLSTKDIKRIAGVSSGAIAGLQVALNYSIDDILHEMKYTDFKTFAEGSSGFFSGLIRLFMYTGLYESENLYRYIARLIKAKTGDENVSFANLQQMKNKQAFKDLYVVATKLFMLNGQPAAIPFIFSHEHTPHARVVDAIRASAALPIAFPPIHLLKQADGKFIVHADGETYVDGGILRAYPIRLFDYPRYMQMQSAAEIPAYNPQTLGLRLESPINIQLLIDKKKDLNTERITTRLQYAEALIYVFRIGQQEVSFAMGPDKERSIIIDTLGITSTDFNLTDEQKEALIQSGEKAVEQLGKISQHEHSEIN